MANSQYFSLAESYDQKLNQLYKP